MKGRIISLAGEELNNSSRVEYYSLTTGDPYDHFELDTNCDDVGGGEVMTMTYQLRLS